MAGQHRAVPPRKSPVRFHGRSGTTQGAIVKILSVVGARPQFVKLAPIAAAAAGRVDHVILHTGQHYDDLMSEVFFRDLGIPHPDVNLDVGSGSHGAQTGAMLAGIETVLEKHRPDWVLVYGDTNSTLAGALAAVKLHLPVAHLEAGLRSFNRRMPEEHNRVLTDHASDMLLCPTELAMTNLAAEGLGERAILVGDVMTDVIHRIRAKLTSERRVGMAGREPHSYRIATIHRPDNTDSPERLAAIVQELGNLETPTVLLVHPRLRTLADRHGIDLNSGRLEPSDPLPYPELVAAVLGSAGVITDSGGLQKEAFLLRVPTTTLRAETEWVETLQGGWNVLVDDPHALADAVNRPAPSPLDIEPFGDGHAAKRTIDVLLGSAR